MKKIICSILFFFSLGCSEHKKINFYPSIFESENYTILNFDEKLKYLDSLSNITNSYKNDSINRSFLTNLSAEYYYLNQNKKSFNISNKVLHLSELVNDTLGMAKSLYYMGDSHEIKQKDSAYYYYQKSRKIISIIE